MKYRKHLWRISFESGSRCGKAARADILVYYVQIRYDSNRMFITLVNAIFKLMEELQRLLAE